jgi:isopropylmalate/homocitrate/citramalate synthase
MVRKVKEVLPIPLGVHCHNSWGVGLANACAAVEAGAEVVDAGINGLAGHAGNVSIDEAAMTFQYLYGFDLGIRPEGFTKVARLVEAISGQFVASNKPIVGRNVYAHSGYHPGTKHVREFPETMEPFPPDLVGNARRYPLQWDTSDVIIRFNLDLLGISDEGVDIEALQHKVIDFARANRREMEPEEFATLVETVRA